MKERASRPGDERSAAAHPGAPCRGTEPQKRFIDLGDAVGLVVSFALCFGVAAFGAQFTPGAWYAQLDKPAWTPPSWVFGPVWSLLYAMMAFAAWWIWRGDGFEKARVAFAAFGLQLLLNGLWSWLFFGLEQPGLAALDIALLWTAILLTVVLFWRRSRLAGALLVPYAAWVSFAAALNLSIWSRNT